MLLRRMIENVREQNWLAVALDFAIVLSGVLIALQVENWSEARRDRAELGLALDRLGAEATANITVIDDFLERVNDREDTWQAAMTALDTCDPSDEARVTVGTAVALLTSDFDPSFATESLNQLSQRPALLALLDPEFRAALDTYQQRLSEDARQTSGNFQLMWNHHIVTHAAVDASFPREDSPATLVLARPMDSVCTDPSFRRQFFITYALLNGLRLRITNLREAVEAFQVTLDKEVAAH